MSRQTILRSGSRFLWIGWMIVLFGCSSKTTTLRGTVTIDGQPVKSGSVLFHYPDGQVFSTRIALDGSYAIPNLPQGTTTIALRNDTLSPVKIRTDVKLPPSINGPKLLPGSSGKEDKLRIPKKYFTPSGSGLILDIQQTAMTFDISLTP